MAGRFDLHECGITVGEVHRNQSDVKQQLRRLFGLDVVTECGGVPAQILWPRDTRSDPAAYDTAARQLAGLFVENFKKHEGGVNLQVRTASPSV